MYSKSRTILPREIIIVEGYLVLANKKVRDELNSSIFLESERNTSFARRLNRDVSERSRTPKSVAKRWSNFVHQRQSLQQSN